MPNHGIFILQRMGHFAKRPSNSVQVVAPIPYCPPLIFFPKWERFRGVPRRESISGLTVHHPRYLLLPKLSMPLHGVSMFLNTINQLLKLHGEHGFDLIDAHYVYPDGFAAVLAARRLGLPVFVSARGSDLNVFPELPTIAPLIRWTLRHATAGIAVSTPLRDKMIALGLSADRSYVIGNGVDLSRFVPLERSECRHRLGVPSGEIILSVGALIESKGHQVAIAALAELLPRHPEVWLFIVGEGPYHNALLECARAHRVADRVRLVGAVPNEELKYWYSAADVNCLFSSREGCPNVLLESIACGTPVVATRVGGIAEVLTSDSAGLIIDHVRLAAPALHSLLQQKPDRHRMRALAQQRSWAKTASQVEEVFSLKLEKPSSRNNFHVRGIHS